MYFYIYDDYLATPKYQAQLAKIEAELSLLEIKGPVSRLNTLTNINAIVKRAITRGATTLIAVGSDATLLKTINVLPNKKIAVGLITVGDKENYLADLLNIKDTKESIEAIAARKIINLNVGQINKQTFLQHLHLTANNFTALMDSSLTIKAAYPQSIMEIVNPHLTSNPKAKPLLECWLYPNKTGLSRLTKLKNEDTSHFNVKKLVIKSQEPFQIKIDGRQIININNVTISAMTSFIRLIVGKKRLATAKKKN